MAGARELAHVAQHLVGLLRRQHRGRLVEDQQPRLEIELLEQFQLLFFAGREFGRASIEVQRERRGSEEFLELGAPGFPVDQRRRLATGQQQVLRHRHAGRQREVLVDHADAERARHHGGGDVLLTPVGDHRAFVRPLEAGDAFHQRALAGAVLAQQGMHAAGRHLHRHVVQRCQATEALGELVGLQRHRACRPRHRVDVQGRHGFSDSCPGSRARVDASAGCHRERRPDPGGSTRFCSSSPRRRGSRASTVDQREAGRRLP